MIKSYYTVFSKYLNLKNERKKKMNATRRRKLFNVVSELYDVLSRLQIIKDEEAEALEAIPESLQGTDRYNAMEENVDNFTEIDEELNEMIALLEDIIGV